MKLERLNFAWVNPVYFFVLVAIVMESVFTVLRPPLQSPDEFFHLCRAYQVSEGQFLPVIKDQRVGGELPACLKEFASFYLPLTFTPQYRVSSIDHKEISEIDCSDKRRIFMDFPNTSTYSPIAYLPHSFALFVLRKLNCSIGTQYFGARLFAFLLYLLCMITVIRIIPIHKWLVVTLLLLPMNLYMLNSFTGDTVTNMLSFLLISLVLKHRFVSEKVKTKDLVLILCVGMLLAFSKVIYSSLLFLLLIIPAKKFPSQIYKYAAIAVVIAISFLLANAWSSTAMKFYPTYDAYNPAYVQSVTIHPTADPHKQLEHLSAHKLHLLKVIQNSITEEPKFYLRSYIGHFGTYMDAPVPDWFFKMAFAVILFVALFEKNVFCLSIGDKLVILFSVCCAYSLIVLSQHLVWNDVGSEKFKPLQGRYLVPLFPLLFMLLNHPWKNIMFDLSLLIVIFSIYTNSYCAKLLYSRYYKEVWNARTKELTCGMETLDAAGNLETGNPKIKLRGNNIISDREHRHGRFSLMLLPDSGGAYWDFKGLKRNDQVELYAWQKGTGGDLVAQGKGPHCAPYRFINRDIQVTDKMGWKKIQLIFPMFMPCDSSEGSFYLFNSTRDTLYFDDITFRLKKYR